jgi:hypothetical protein
VRSAALVLGLIGGLLGLFVGMFSYGYTEAIEHYGEMPGLFEQVANVDLIRTVSFLSPLLAIAGAGMAKVRALWGGVLLVASAVGMFVAFGVNVFTLFPMGFCAVAGLMALAGAQPDEPKAHFQR